MPSNVSCTYATYAASNTTSSRHERLAKPSRAGRPSQIGTPQRKMKGSWPPSRGCLRPWQCTALAGSEMRFPLWAASKRLPKVLLIPLLASRATLSLLGSRRQSHYRVGHSVVNYGNAGQLPGSSLRISS